MSQVSVLPVASATAKDVPLRFLTAASLFDGHDASINIMRRILQGSGVEVIHLAHNRSVNEILQAALQEDVDGIAISSYQGGHVEYFKYLVDQLREHGAGHIKVFGGGGGVIVYDEIQELESYGVERIYSPHAGQEMGLQGMIDDMITRTRDSKARPSYSALKESGLDGLSELARALSKAELGLLTDADKQWVAENKLVVPVVGITGTGGAGKSSLTDELIRRFRLDSNDEVRIATIAIDPTRRKTGGALLGDRIRMNAIYHPNIFMRSLATRSAAGEVPEALAEVIDILKCAQFDLLIVETPGIGQGDSAIEPYVDCSMYVMTPEFGAQSQLEKIDMLDFADLVVINKFDRKGSDDALRDVSKQVQRNRQAFDTATDKMPVFGSIASRFNDDGVTAAYQHLLGLLREKGLKNYESLLPMVTTRSSSEKTVIVPGERQRYLAEIAQTVRAYHDATRTQSTIARERQQLLAARAMLGERNTTNDLDELIAQRSKALDADSHALLDDWPAIRRDYQGDEIETQLPSGKSFTTVMKRETLSGSLLSRVAVPGFEDHGELLRFLRSDNLPGYFPYTAGVFPFKREGEDPARMFAGEGDPDRTNRRFKKLSEHSKAKRLSTAFDSVTLYGCDPAERPDIYGKIGNSGVSVATLTDMKELYDGFDLCDPSTSVSMTINGPAPTILAMFLTTAIDQQRQAFIDEHGREPDAAESDQLREYALQRVRGTVQADILKEDQGQNTCIFST
ncbi:MAG: methylmalonyl-CoA mutase family protein, partial [Pseudomonadota bacterium]